MAQLLPFPQHPRLWRGRGNQPQQPAWPSGYAALDQLLPGGGWPQGALSEILLPGPGYGELSLLLPAVAKATQEDRSIALIAQPLVLNGPNMNARGVQLDQLLLVDSDNDNDARWAAEQCLRSQLFAFVLVWPGRCDDRHLRRLQLAAEYGQCAGILFRSSEYARTPSPAQLRLCLGTESQPEQSMHEVTLALIKARGLACSAAQPRKVTINTSSYKPATAVIAGQ